MVQGFTVIKEMDKIELVVPAGGFEHLKAAINAGADSIYAGYERYSARAYADNFSLKTLEKAANYCELNKVKFYLALNTLIKENELSGLIDFLADLTANIKVDAFIIQDFALLKILKDIDPAVPVHISTQVNIHNTQSAMFLKSYGIKRIILAREMTFKEISYLARQNIAEIEVFVHGSQCYSHSGQCYFSSMVGQRSGNRGTCPQPCRLKYRTAKKRNGDFKEEGYFISKTDLSLIQKLPGLIQAGVKALKIEGRMKTPDYVTIVTSIYRKYIDTYYSGSKYQVSARDLQKLKQVYSRKQTSGYYFEEFPNDIISDKKPVSTGNLFGRISDIKILKEKKIMIIDTGMSLSSGDILEVWTKKGNEKIEVSSFTREKNENKKIKKNRYKIEAGKDIFFSIGDRVFKYFDKELEQEIKIILNKKNISEKKPGFFGKNQGYVQKTIPEINSKNIKNNIIYNAPSVREQLFKKIAGLKPGTSVSLITSRLDEIKNIIESTSQKNVSGRNFKEVKLNIIYDPFSERPYSGKKIDKCIEELNDLNAAGINEKIFFYFATPPVVHDSFLKKVNEYLEFMLENNFFNFYITSYAFLNFLNNYKLNEKRPINVIFAHNLNITNSFTLLELIKKTKKKLSLQEVILSPEITIEEAGEMMADFYKKIIDKDSDIPIPLAALYSYGYFPVMLARVRYGLGDKFFLKDRKEFVFAAKSDYFGNTIIFNSKKHNLLEETCHFFKEFIFSCLIDARLLDVKEAIFALNMFIKAMSINDIYISDYADSNKIRLAKKEMKSLIDASSSSDYLRDFTKGHALKGVI